MKLELAEKIAAGLVERLAPLCAEICAPGVDEVACPFAIAVAGSIRRRRPQVNDIDLVALPRLETVKHGLFEESAEEPHKSQLAFMLCATLARQVHARGPKNISVQLEFPDELRGEIPAVEFAAGVRVDLYLATPDTWASTLLIRTGSKEHNIWLCQRARELGGRLHADGTGLELPDPEAYDHVRQCSGPLRRITSASEDEILAALCFGSAPAPARRECVNGRPLWARTQESEVRTKNSEVR